MQEHSMVSLSSEIKIYDFFLKLRPEAIYFRPLCVIENKVRELTDILLIKNNSIFVIEVKHFEPSIKGKNSKSWKHLKNSISKSINQTSFAEEIVLNFPIFRNVEAEIALKDKNYDKIEQLNGYNKYKLKKGSIINLANGFKVFKLSILINIDSSIKKFKKNVDEDYNLIKTDYPGLIISNQDMIRGFEYRQIKNNFVTILTEGQLYFVFKYLKSLNSFIKYLNWKEQISNYIEKSKEQNLVSIYITNNLKKVNFKINDCSDETIKIFEKNH